MPGRFQYTPPWRAGWLGFYAGHGGDEYGNCSVYARFPLLGYGVFFYGRHYQTEVELPEPGECVWVDRRYYPDGDTAVKRWREQP